MMDSFSLGSGNTVYSPFTSSSSIVVEDIITPFSPILSYYPNNVVSNIPNVSISGYNARNNTGYSTGYGTGYMYNPVYNTSGYNIGYTSNIGYPSVYNTNLNGTYYYDSGIGENSLARHETNVDLRYKFLDKWLYNDDNQDILKMLKIDGKSVKVLSKSETEKNDISKDTESDIEQKSDFIGSEILTLAKNNKILEALCKKNSLKYYDLPHNQKYVQRAQAKYVKHKLTEMQK